MAQLFWTLETKAKGLRRLSTIAVKDLVIGGVGFSRVKSPRPQGAGQRQSFLLWGGKARTEGSPGLGKDIPSANALFGGPASVGNVAAKIASIMDKANSLLLEVGAKRS